MSSAAIISFSAYVSILLFIGIYFYYKQEEKRLSDYVLAGRNVGMIPTGISQVASVATGFVFFAWVGAGFLIGLSNLWYSFLFITANVVVYRFVGSRIRRQSEEYDSVTIVDHMVKHYQRRREENVSHMMRFFGTLTAAVFLIAFIGAQFIALGSSMEIVLGVDYAVAIILGGLVVAVYTTLGGFNASIWTDVVQAIVVIFGLLAIPILAMNEIGGWWAFIEEARSIDPLLLSWHGGETPQAFLLTILAWIGLALPAVGAPHSVQRMQAIRSERFLSGASVAAATFDTMRYVIPLFIGICARILYGSVDNPENAAMMLIVDLFPAWLAGILLAGVISSILSSADSIMIVLASDFTRNAYESYISPDATEQQAIVVGKIIVVVTAFVGIIIALLQPATILDIVFFAWLGLGASLGAPLIAVLFYSQLTGEGAVAGVVVGLVSTVTAQYLYPELYPIIVWPLTIFAIIGVSRLRPRAQPTKTVETGD